MTKILQLFSAETQLVNALQKGDAKAQRQLYDKYAGRMLAICVRYVSDRMAAEDVMIEGFMKIFERIGQFRNEGSFEGWIKRLMTNEALAYLRSNKQFEVIDLDQAEVQHITNFEQPDQHVETEELFEILEKLPTGYRTVFNLYAIEGYTHAEIAVQLNISESTSKSQLHRARAMLQEMLMKLKRKENHEKASDR